MIDTAGQRGIDGRTEGETVGPGRMKRPFASDDELPPPPLLFMFPVSVKYMCVLLFVSDTLNLYTADF